MNPAAAKRLRLLASSISVLLVIAIIIGAWFYWRIRASIPQVDGAAKITGLTATAKVARDAQGVPTIRAENRADVARALGWLHGQERFFQMDLLRRGPAGELAELFGKRAVPRDRATRTHGFRKLAQTVASRLSPNERAILDAYTAGVNAGLSGLAERPFEYLLMRETPVPWRPEDSLLVIYAMTLDLQDEEGIYERSLMTLRDKLGLEALAFFAPLLTPNDAALDGSTGTAAPMPTANMINLRGRKIGSSTPARQRPMTDVELRFPFRPRDREAVIGSNVFALAGAHTATGAAMVANDMHLDHSVPNIWYRASFEYEGRKVTGVTLPGTPAMVAGSNGNVAWGFTSAYVDTGDMVVVEVNSIANSLYKSPDREGLVEIERRKETIRVKDDKSIEAEYSWTIWGPIIGNDERHRPLALRWVAHDPDATNLSLLAMETVTSVADGIAAAHKVGIPAQNMLLGDKSGAIAWTIAGRLPKRVGYDGRLPVTWAFGDRKWDGLLPPDEVPVILGDQSQIPGKLWSANNRHVGGENLAKLGDGAFRRAPRAAQIRDDLAPLQRATPRDLLAVQLDDRALFLAPWHKLLMDVLNPAATKDRKPREALRAFSEKWEGRASIDAVSYRLVREFRTAVYALVFPPIFASCVEAFPAFESRDFQLEGAAWAMLRAKPLHLLNPRFASWDDLLLAAVDETIRGTDKDGIKLPRANWGWRNTADIRHPFSSTSSWLGHWLDMPADPLPGDSDMPRVQSPTHGASERMVVSPGHEQDGIFHMPVGQSGHPLSPYFRAGHEAWVRGDPTPFLPGKTERTLTLTP